MYLIFLNITLRREFLTLNNLREARRQQAEQDAEGSGSSLLTSAILASAGLSVLSRFASRSSASRSSPRRSSVVRHLSNSPRRSSVALPSDSPSAPTVASSAKQRVASLRFRFSTSQAFTQGDGTCMLYAQ